MADMVAPKLAVLGGTFFILQKENPRYGGFRIDLDILLFFK